MWRGNHLKRFPLIHIHAHTHTWVGKINVCNLSLGGVCVLVCALEARPIGLTVHSLFMNETPSPRSPQDHSTRSTRPPLSTWTHCKYNMPWLPFFCTVHPVRRLQSKKKRLRFTDSRGHHFSTGFLEFSEPTTLGRTRTHSKPHTHCIVFQFSLVCVINGRRTRGTSSS